MKKFPVFVALAGVVMLSGSVLYAAENDYEYDSTHSSKYRYTPPEQKRQEESTVNKQKEINKQIEDYNSESRSGRSTSSPSNDTTRESDKSRKHTDD